LDGTLKNAVKEYIIHLAIHKMTVILMIDNHTEAFSQILKCFDARAGVVQQPTGPAEEGQKSGGPAL